MSAIKLALQQNQKRDRRKTPEAKSGEVSPDSKCPICLDVFKNIAYLNICLHKFCFRCIHEWSKNKAECPLCKQPFNSIYHSIKSEQDFKQYDLKPVTNGSFGMCGGVRFRYRTTLTGVQQQRRRRTSPPPDNGVLFESPANPPQPQQTRYIRHMMMRMAAKRRAAREGRASANVRELEMVNFRRELYRQGLRVRAVRDGGRSRNTSAEFYRENPACLHRLIPWLKRELVVIYGAHGSLLNIVQHIIMSRITRVNMEDRAIQEELWPFLRGRTEHFLHEFISFAKSPFNMEAYDQHATYEGSAHSSNSDISPNSSVIAISEDEDMDLEPPRTPGYPTSNLSRSLWDDETPGPSYSTTAEQDRTETESIHDSDSDSSLDEEAQEIPTSPMQQENALQIHVDDCLSSESDDCVIVGFIKPRAERTPELVHLSSDDYWSDDVQEAPPLPQHVHFDSDSPSASPKSPSIDPDRRHPLETKEKLDTLKSKVCRASRESKRKGRDGFETSGRKHDSKDRKHKKKRSSTERRRHSRSPVRCHSRERDYCYSKHRDRKYDSKSKRKDGDFYDQASRKPFDRRYRSRSRSWEPRRQERWKSRSRSRSRSRAYSTSPSTRRYHHEKPGGKRKYKTRHLENPSSPKNHVIETRPTDEEEERSPSVRSKHHKKKKKKHKRRSRRHRSAERRSQTPITIESDSDGAVDTWGPNPFPVNEATDEPNFSIFGFSL